MPSKHQMPSSVEDGIIVPCFESGLGFRALPASFADFDVSKEKRVLGEISANIDMQFYSSGQKALLIRTPRGAAVENEFGFERVLVLAEQYTCPIVDE